MGNEKSTSEDSKSCLFDEQDISDYYGLKTNTSESNEFLEDYSKFNSPKEKIGLKKEISNTESEKSSVIPTTFQWDNGGNSVYLTGSFCKWNQFFLMKKISPGSFILTLNLPRGKHEYKFKVDNQWKFDQKCETCNNNGNINNVLDTTKWEITVINNDERTTALSTNNTDTYYDNSNKNLEKVKNEYISKMKYSNTIPDKDAFSEKIPALPGHYQSCENINSFSNQKYIGNEKHLRANEKDILSENLAYKKIENVHHEQINHLIVNKDKKQTENNTICSFTSRYRFKFTTFVYYKPQNNKE